MNFKTSFDLIAKTDAIETVPQSVIEDLQCQFLSIMSHYGSHSEVTFSLGYCGTLFYMHDEFTGVAREDRAVLIGAMRQAIQSWSHSPLTYAIEFEVGLDSKACADEGTLSDVLARLEALHRSGKACVSFRSYIHFPEFPELEEESKA